MNDYRQIFYCELAPERFVSVCVKGPFDSDAWLALELFLKKTETQPLSANSPDSASAEPK